MNATEMTDTLQRIRAKLQQLRTRDVALAQFGANEHGYRIGRPLTPAELQAHEQRMGVSLPDEYRRFLTELGHGGAGPYYGLFTLGSRDPECINVFGGDLSKPFPWTDRFNPDEWERGCGVEGVEWYEDGKYAGMFLPGALYLCHYGCGLRFFLIVSGPCKGEVWRDWQADGEGIAPVLDAQGIRMGFVNCYELWLDQSLKGLLG
jgi:hypothetical protein